MRYKFKIRGKNGIPNPFKGIEVKYADTSIVGELKVDKEGKINGFRAKHQVLECNKEKLIVGPRKGFASYVNSKLNENGAYGIDADVFVGIHNGIFTGAEQIE